MKNRVPWTAAAGWSMLAACVNVTTSATGSTEIPWAARFASYPGSALSTAVTGRCSLRSGVRLTTAGPGNTGTRWEGHLPGSPEPGHAPSTVVTGPSTHETGVTRITGATGSTETRWAGSQRHPENARSTAAATSITPADGARRTGSGTGNTVIPWAVGRNISRARNALSKAAPARLWLKAGAKPTTTVPGVTTGTRWRANRSQHRLTGLPLERRKPAKWAAAISSPDRAAGVISITSAGRHTATRKHRCSAARTGPAGEGSTMMAMLCSSCGEPRSWSTGRSWKISSAGSCTRSRTCIIKTASRPTMILATWRSG